MSETGKLNSKEQDVLAQRLELPGSPTGNSTGYVKPAVDHRLFSRTTEVLEQWRIFSTILLIGKEAYLLLKSTNVLTRWTCTLMEKLVAIILQSLEKLIKPILPLVVLADWCISGFLRDFEQKFPVLKKSPEQVFDAINDRVRPISAPVAHKATKMTNLGRKRVHGLVKNIIKFGRRIIKAMEYFMDTLDNSVDPRRRRKRYIAYKRTTNTTAGKDERGRRSQADFYRFFEESSDSLHPVNIEKLESASKQLERTNYSNPTNVFKSDNSATSHLGPMSIYRMDGESPSSRLDPTDIYKLNEGPSRRLDPTDIYKLNEGPSTRRLDPTDIYKLNEGPPTRRLDPTDIYKLNEGPSTRPLDPTDIYNLNEGPSTRPLDPTDIYKLNEGPSTRRLDPTDIYKLTEGPSTRRLDPTDIYKLNEGLSTRLLDPTDIYNLVEESPSRSLQLAHIDKMNEETPSSRLDSTVVDKVDEETQSSHLDSTDTERLDGESPNSRLGLIDISKLDLEASTRLLDWRDMYRLGETSTDRLDASVFPRRWLEPTNLSGQSASESEELDPTNVKDVTFKLINTVAKIGFFYIGTMSWMASRIPLVGTAVEEYPSPMSTPGSTAIAR